MQLDSNFHAGALEVDDLRAVGVGGDPFLVILAKVPVLLDKLAIIAFDSQYTALQNSPRFITDPLTPDILQNLSQHTWCAQVK